MVHPTYRKQEEIERTIVTYLRRSEGKKKTWTELAEMARKDRISKATLSRYLKEFERKYWVKRIVDEGARPPRVLYQMQNAADPMPRLRRTLTWLKSFGSEGGWRDRKLSNPDRSKAASFLAEYLSSWFDIVLRSLANLYVCAAKSPPDGPRTQLKAFAARLELVFEELSLNQVEPYLVKHRDIVQKAVERTLRRFGYDREDIRPLRKYWAMYSLEQSQ